MSSLNYRSEIDGLRALAVTAVIVFHASPSLLPGGYLGVDVFFVISGFLITSIIAADTARGNFSFVRFWDRRIRRIVPASSFIILLTSVFSFFFLYLPDVQFYTGHKLSALLSYANIYSWINIGDYWGLESEASPYTHFWSLSLEEQFYIFYPLLLVVFVCRKNEFRCSYIIIATLISFVIYIVGLSYGHVDGVFYMLPARAWQLGVGCLAALYEKRIRFGRNLVTSIAGVLIMVCAIIHPMRSFCPCFGSVAAVIGALLVILAGKNNFTRIFLANPISVQVGRLSYVLYLAHWPILIVLKSFVTYGFLDSKPLVGLSFIFILAVVSAVTHLAVENPLRKWKYGSLAAIVMVVLVLVWTAALELNNYALVYNKQFDKPAWHGIYYDSRTEPDDTQAFRLLLDSVNAPAGPGVKDQYLEGGVINLRGSQTPEVVLIGDSHAVMWGLVVDSVCQDLGYSCAVWAVNGETPFMRIPLDCNSPGRYMSAEEKCAYDRSRLEILGKWNPEVIILAARWEMYSDAETHDLLLFLGEHFRNVVFVESPPVLDKIGNRSFVNFSSYLGISPEQTSESEVLWPVSRNSRISEMRQKLSALAESRNNFHMLPISDLYLRNDKVLAGRGTAVYYLDDDHLVDDGALISKDRFAETLKRILRPDVVEIN